MKTTSALFLAGLWLLMLVPDPAHAQCEDAQLLATNGEANDKFGGTVDTDGSSSIVGAIGFANTEGEPHLFGAAYIFELSGDPAVWTQKARFLGEASREGAINFGSAVAIQGDHALVAANTYDSATLSNTGAVFYYHREGSPATWVHKQTIVEDIVNLRLGKDMDINTDGDVFVVGATGVAFVYTRSGTTWTRRGDSFTGSDTISTDLFGESVAIADEDVVVGAFLWEGAEQDQGAVYTFSWSGSQYTEDDLISIETGAENDNFGTDVVMDGVSLLVSAKGATSGGTVYPYLWNSGTGKWDALAVITVSGSHKLGRSMGLAGNFAVLSSHAEDNGEGVAYRTVLNTDVWANPVAFQASSPETSAFFSSDVSAGGSAIGIIGEPERNLTGESNAGAAYIFDLNCTP